MGRQLQYLRIKAFWNVPTALAYVTSLENIAARLISRTPQFVKKLHLLKVRMPSHEEAAIDAHSRSALSNAKHNLRYLYNPQSVTDAPTRRRTRAVLRLLRSSIIFVFWRLVRYAKYVAIGSLVATIGAGALGTFASGAGFVLAPTGIAGTIMAGSVWGLGKFAVRRIHKRWEKGHGYGEMEESIDERRGAVRRMETGPEAVPW
jgi:hypothetical protein